MENYINQVVETAQRLSRTGFEINNNWVGSLLLAGLPDRFAPMIIAIEHSGISIQTDAIKSKLLDMNTEAATNRKTGGAFAIGTVKRKKRNIPRYRNSNNEKNNIDSKKV